MKPKFNRFLRASIASVLAMSSSVWAAEIIKSDNTNLLDLGTSWATGAPGALDVATWSGTYNTAGSLSAAFTASTPVSWGGIKIGSISGTAAGLVSIGGTGAAVTGSSVTIGSSGIDMSGANQNLVINAATINFNTSQTWNVATGRNLRFGTTGTTGANANVDGSSSSAVITITGGGVVDANQGGGSGFSDAAGFAGFAGKWQVNSGTTLRGIRNGATAWGSNTSSDAILLNGGTLAVGGVSGTQGSWTWTTPISLAASTTSSIDQQIYSGTGRSLKLNGVISGSGNVVFRETGATDSFNNDDLSYILTGANTMSGTVTIGGATENGITGRLSSVRIGGASGNDTTTGAGTGGSLGTAGVVNNGVLTLSRSDTWTFGNTVSGTGSLRIGGAVSGAGTQVVTVSGTNSYSGATTIGQGRLNLTGSLTSNIAVQAAGKISGTGSTTGTLSTVAGAGIALAGGGTYTSLVANGVTIGGATTVSFLTNPTAATSYDVFKYGAGGLTGAANLSAAWRGSFVDDTLNQKYTFVTGATATRTWNTTTGTWDNTGVNSNWVEGDLKFYDGDSAVFGDIASDSTITLSGTIAPTAVTVQNSANVYTFQTGSIAGASTLAKTGSGILVLAAANTFTGATTISGGALRVGNSLALQNSSVTNNASGGLAFATGVTNATVGSLGGSGDISLLNAGSAAVALTAGGNNASSSYTGQLSGAGSLIKTGTGTLTLSGSNGYTGGTTLNAGTLVTGHVSALGTGAINVNGGTLDLDANLTAASLAGSSSAVDAGTYTLTLNAASNAGTFYSGTFTSTGSLVLRGGSQTVQDHVTGGAGSGSGNFLIIYNLGAGSSFQLDTGASSTDRRDFGWANDSGTVLNLTSLQGYGAIRGDVGGPTGGVRNIVVNQATDTTFDGAILSHTSGPGALRSFTLTKQGSGSLTLAGFLGEQTASSGTGADVVNLTVQAGILNVTNSANGTASNGTAGTMTVTGGTLAFSNNALGKGGAGSVVMNGGTLRWNSGNTQDLTVSSRLTLVAGKAANFDTNGNNVSFANALGGGAINASLTKTGTGTLTLDGANIYTGATIVSQGALVINGSVSTGDLTVQSGASLMGSGTIGGATTIDAGGTLSPGNSPGLLTVNSTLTLAGTTLMEIGGTTLGSDYDSVSVSGLLTYGGDLNIVSYNTYNLAQVASYNLFSLSGDETGTFNSVSVGALALVNDSGVWSAEDGGLTYTFTESTGTLVVIPEPKAALLGGIGMFLLLRRRRAA